MHIPKRYGQSKIINCPFCGKQAITKNSQGIPVCLEHKKSLLPDMKCICGEWLDIKNGKFGPYFYCMKCGNINFNRALEMNPGWNKKDKSKNKPKEYIIKSTDVDRWF